MSNSYEEKRNLVRKDLDRFLIGYGINRFGERLKQAMDAKGITSNVKMGEMCDMSDTVIRNYLIGKTYPTLDRLSILAHVLDCSPSWLLTGEIEGKQPNDNHVQDKSDNPNIYSSGVGTVLDLLSESQRETLSNVIIAHGISGIISALNGTTTVSDFLQLSESERERVLRLYNQVKGGDAETGGIITTPPLSKSDKKAG
ncbi:helix-turn-helix domain-containing protein [Klebsiella oxytoca]|uniref:helix-turn-helix domain-containing protein n=1 Tax=Klebsiella oxytoca TaxID=571 RepID=UPI00024FB8DB|nr:helix-turn-helix domain-containing protein [Klebsiella oxytoca]EHS93356.1 hypothetical protein HMPREF9689_03429 [Klebsiella oxytoca 10-5245]EKX5082267.1 helix-turn-helix domain-containing protein [Klebsiella oxytoca]EKX5094882.1 helix-turn-helix domain-containing protein [Klebsiella oxytoca]ELM1662692.1 helix-turn-helix domain-containing protein [Klebsiella oxytoca]MCY3429809.1 helix-turn-helix domain-containing protein [Klebsiella oxytoca]